MKRPSILANPHASVLAFGLVMLIAIGALSYRSTLQLADDAARVKQAQEIRTSLTALLSIINDAETGQRGYVLTGDEAYLKPFLGAAERAAAEYERLRDSTNHDVGYHRTLDALRPLILARIRGTEEVVELRRSSGFDAAAERILSGQGKVVHDHIRQLIGEIDADICLEIQRRENLTKRAVSRTLAAIGFGGAAAVIICGTALLLMQRNIIARQKAEVSLRIMNDELRLASERAKSSDRVKSAFLATMSHELRTPLNSIIGFTGVILQGLAGPVNDEQKKQLEMVRGSARHLLALINDILDISKIEAGELEVRIEAFDLRHSIHNVMAMVRPLADKKGLHLHCDLPVELGTWVSDRRRVEQVLINLLNNGLKFTEQGEVRLTATVTACALEIHVSDTGIGIEPSDLATLFQPFRQVDSSLTRQRDGTGLGLAICRRLAELLGGQMAVTSTEGLGSVFTLTLPRKD